MYIPSWGKRRRFENITTTELRRVFLYVFVLVVSVAIHEFGHAFMADRLGDDTRAARVGSRSTRSRTPIQ